MKYLGIDYGTKKIGFAVSDDRGVIAFPWGITENNPMIINTIKKIIDDTHIEKIVIGKSMDSDGQDNPVQKKIHQFADLLKKETGLAIDMQDERFSSIAARGHLYRKGNIAHEQWSGKENKKRREPVDAGAAAIILQRYLDKKKESRQ